MAAVSGKAPVPNVESSSSLADTRSDRARPKRRLTRRGGWFLAIGIAVIVAAAGVGYLIYSEYYAPPFHNAAWQVSNPGTNVLDEVVGNSIYVVNSLSGNFPGNSTLLLRSISISSGSVDWQATTTVSNYLAIPSITALTAESGTIVFAYYDMFDWLLVVDFFNETTGALSGNSSFFVGIANNEVVRAVAGDLYFSGVEEAATSPPNEFNLTYTVDGYTLGATHATPFWNETTWLGYGNSFGTSSSGFFLDPWYAVGWEYQFGKVVATNLSTGMTQTFTNDPFQSSVGTLTGGDLYDLQSTSNSWSLGEFSLKSGEALTRFTLPESTISNSTGNALLRADQEFLVSQSCGFIGLSQCSANLSSYSNTGSKLWEVSIGGSINPGSTGYSVYFPTNQTVLFVGTPSAYLGPDGTSSSYQTVFVLVALGSGQVLDRVTYGYSLNFPNLSPGFGSATPVLHVYAAAEDKVIYSYGSDIAASTV